LLEINKIYNMDCLEGMKIIPDESVDLIFTSPPYNLGNQHHTGNNRFKPYTDDLPEEEYQKWQLKVLTECYRILKPNGSMWYNHKNRIKKGRQITPYEWLLKSQFVIKQEIIWFNGSQNFDKIRFYPMTERLYWLAKSPKTTLQNVLNHHDVFTRAEWKPEGTKSEFKRAFPVKMVQDILSCFPKAETVLDPFMGSGTTAISCINTNRNYIGFELNKEYYEIAKNRINKHIIDNNLQDKYNLIT